jgi:uncharacterized protein
MKDFLRKQFAPESLRLDLKALGEGMGSFSGYGAVYGNVDRDEEVILPGAFAASLDSFVRDGFIGVAHDWDDSVATIKSASEDSYGLLIDCEFHGDSESQAQRQKMLERLERGKTVGLSVGFRVLEWGYDEEKEVRTIIRGDLYEVSIVTVPANPLAVVGAAKGANGELTERGLEHILRDAGIGRGLRRNIISHGLKAALRDAGSNGETIDDQPGETPDDNELYTRAELILAESGLALAGFGS